MLGCTIEPGRVINLTYLFCFVVLKILHALAGAGCSSVDSVPAFEAVGRRIDPSHCSFGYFPFQPVVHNWFIKGRGMYCSVYGKVHIKTLAVYRKE